MIKSKQLVAEYREQIGKYTYEDMDCIKSIANIINRYGGKSDLMGSNWYARHEIQNLRPLTEKSQLYDGCAVLKTRLPGEPGHNLPPRYAKDVVQIDYSHIGLGTDEGLILDSTTVKSGDIYIRNGPGVSTAPIGTQSWDVIGEFEDVDYSDRTNSAGFHGGKVEPETGKTALVVASVGNTVNLRSMPAANSVVLEYVLIGTKVRAGEANGGWIKVFTPKGKQGWMQKEFLSMTAVTATPNSVPGAEPQTIINPNWIEKLKQAITLIDEVLGDV